MSVNKAIIIGNLTRDPESRTIPSGQSVCSFGVATNRTWRNQQSGEKQTETEFHNVVAWGRLADTCGQYLKKGSKVFIEGRLRTRSWNDQNGVKKYRTEIVAQNMVMLDKKPAASGPVQETKDLSKEATPAEEEEINVEDIPF